MSHCIYLIKATRRPYLIKQVDENTDPISSAEEAYKWLKVFDDANLTASGISVQVISTDYMQRVGNITIGGFELHGIPVVYQCGGW